MASRASLRRPLAAGAARAGRQLVRAALAAVPEGPRHALYRGLARVDPSPAPGLEVKVADTREELEACFAILHDAYVASGFMKPDPSGLRVTIWHALPTTTTICAKVDGRVVGTLSMVREGVFGLPMQSAFALDAVRAQPGRIAEISALAVHREHRRTGGTVLFPLMKFMYEYAVRCFDTRHLVIAVNPNKIALYEALLFFRRLEAAPVEHYAFANGAAAVGATLDLFGAPAAFEGAYAGRDVRRDLHRYFTQTRLPQLRLPQRRYHTTNDPVMTPALLDHFFNRRTRVFDGLDERQRALLHQTYAGPAWAAVLPALPASAAAAMPLRRHARHSLKAPGWLIADGRRHALNLIEIARAGARVDTGARALPLAAEGELCTQLGDGIASRVKVRVRRDAGAGQWGLEVLAPDGPWLACVDAIESHAGGAAADDGRADTSDTAPSVMSLG